MSEVVTNEPEVQTIVAKLVPDDVRHQFLPKYYRSAFMWAESLTYEYASRFIAGYSGGYWEFFELSNGAFFMAPSGEDLLRLVVTDNYTDVEVSPEAAGIVVTLYTLNYLMHARVRAAEKERFIELYCKLLDYVLDHKDGAAIRKAID